MRKRALSSSLIGIELPRDVTSVEVRSGKLHYHIAKGERSIDLPDGHWNYLGLASEISEEIAAGLVGKHTWSDGVFIYRDYENKLKRDFVTNDITAVQSLASWIRAAGMEVDSTSLLTK